MDFPDAINNGFDFGTADNESVLIVVLFFLLFFVMVVWNIRFFSNPTIQKPDSPNCAAFGMNLVVREVSIAIDCKPPKISPQPKMTA